VNSHNPLANIRYSNKVKEQATFNDYHGFPEVVDAFGADGNAFQRIGGDGLTYTHVEISGGYMNEEGVFHYIIGPNNICNHRIFEPY
jgi:hypothetical protein